MHLSSFLAVKNAESEAARCARFYLVLSRRHTAAALVFLAVAEDDSLFAQPHVTQASRKCFENFFVFAHSMSKSKASFSLAFAKNLDLFCFLFPSYVGVSADKHDPG